MLRTFLSNSGGGIKVLAINLPYLVVRDVAACFDPRVDNSAAVLQRYPRHRGKLQEVYAVAGWLPNAAADDVNQVCVAGHVSSAARVHLLLQGGPVRDDPDVRRACVCNYIIMCQ